MALPVMSVETIRFGCPQILPRDTLTVRLSWFSVSSSDSECSCSGGVLGLTWRITLTEAALTGMPHYQVAMLMPNY